MTLLFDCTLDYPYDSVYDNISFLPLRINQTISASNRFVYPNM